MHASAFVRFCAWWHEKVAVTCAVNVHHLVFSPFWHLYRPDLASDKSNFQWVPKLADAISDLVRFVLLDWVVWFFAEDYLREQWRIEDEETDRKFWAKRQAELREKGL